MKQDRTKAGDHSCPVCGETARNAHFQTRDYHYHIPGEWTVAKCVGCSLVQLDPMMTDEELGSLYPDDFYAFSDIGAKRSTFVGWLKKLLFRSLEVEDPLFPAPGRILDSGSGSGWALAEFKQRGWECHGVEPSGAAAAFGRDHYGVDLRAGTVHTVKYPDAHFDYVRSNHSLEHDPRAGETIREFRRIIKPGGKLLIGVPNIGGIMPRLYGRYWYYLGAPVHTYNFNQQQLTRLLEKWGFEIERVRHCGNCGGVLGSLQIWLNRNDPRRASSDGVLMNSSLLKAGAQVVSAFFNAIGQGDCIEVTARPKASV
jgi:SAM-dependent methyltransferase